jgi:hypothetical protein
MEPADQCPRCGIRLAEDSTCPFCRTGAVSEELAVNRSATSIALKAILAIAIGIIPGIVLLSIGVIWLTGVIVMIAVPVILLAFTFAKVSVRNVAGLTAGVIIARNAPAPMRDAIIKEFTKSKGEDDPAQNGSKTP